MDANQIIVYAAVANLMAVHIEKNNKPFILVFYKFHIGFIKKITIIDNFSLVLGDFLWAKSCIQGLDKPRFCMYNAQTLQWDMRFDNIGQMWYEGL